MRAIVAVFFAGCLAAQQSGNIDINQIKAASKKGNGTQLQTFGGGSTTAGHAAVYNAGGAVIDGGGSGGGGGLLTNSPVIFPRYQAPIVPLGLSVTSPVTVANSITSTSIIGSVYFGSATLPAGYWIGKPIKVRASGLYGSTSTPTLTVTIILGGVTIATLTPTILAAVSNDGWQLDYQFTPVSMTAANGAGCFRDVGTSGAIIGGCASGQTTGLNFATSQVLDVKVQWSAASASNTITAEVLQVS